MKRARLTQQERQAQIIALVQREGIVRIAALADLFAVTTETARRDLDDLAQAGAINRTYGGGASRSLTEEPGIGVMLLAPSSRGMGVRLDRDTTQREQVQRALRRSGFERIGDDMRLFTNLRRKIELPPQLFPGPRDQRHPRLDPVQQRPVDRVHHVRLPSHDAHMPNRWARSAKKIPEGRSAGNSRITSNVAVS